ncbi:hypothetical protein LUZ62_070510 [Rhynchospora pubera]|uniref:Integrase catalytic domain-containing protein n=1 Tax=Rhynchospora pubera TaxID=906938 RepID=A0AAV8CX08_9POAL|nr:hypothetical protein LUZ62_070510 [Rhynchospora pubera]
MTTCKLVMVPVYLFIILDHHTKMVLLEASCINGLYYIQALPQIASPQAYLGIRTTAQVWHDRLCHPSNFITLQLVKDYSLPCSSFTLDTCHNCLMAKSHRLPFVSSSSFSSFPLELVHSDVWGPSPIVSNNGFRYYVIFIDDFSRFTWIYFLKNKSDVLHVFQRFKAQVENLFETTIKTLRTDGGTEYKPIANVFPQIIHQTSCPYTPQQNGVSERKHRHIIELALATMSNANLPSSFWDEIFSSIVYIINRLPSHNSTIPYNTLFNKEPDYSSLRVLGCACFPYTRPYNANKLDLHALKCVFIGYSTTQKGYRCLHIPTNKIYVSRHVQFDELSFPFKTSPSQIDSVDHYGSPQNQSIPLSVFRSMVVQDFPESNQHIHEPVSASCAGSIVAPTTQPIITPAHPPVHIASPQVSAQLDTSPARHVFNETDRTPTRVSSSDHTYPGNLPTAPNSEPLISQPDNNHTASISDPLPSISHQPSSTHQMITRTRDNTRKPRHFPDFVAHLTTTDHEPRTFTQANTHTEWRQAMSAEIDALAANNTWILVPPPSNQTIIGCKWVYRIKRRSDGTIDRYKARLVAKGYNQQEGVDYFDTFSPVVRPTTIRVVLSLAVSKKWPIRQLDVNNAFLHGDLAEQVFMSQSPGFIDSTRPNHVCLLSKSLYGLKQSPRAWFYKLSSTLISLGFFESQYDPSLFISHSHNHLTIILVYVDDIIITGSNPSLVSSYIAHLHSSFSLKDLGDLHFFLGIQITKTPTGIHLNQSKYIYDILHKANMIHAKHSPTPMSTSSSLSKDDSTPFDNPQLFRSIIGALQYATLTRPDITFAVNKISQFMQNPTLNHWAAVKRILRFLCGTIRHGIHLQAASNLDINVYCDADWAGCPVDRRSTTGFCIYLGKNLVSWSAKKQPTVSRSSTEAEYRALAITCAELLWVRYLLQELRVMSSTPPTIWCDNIGATFLASNPIFHARTKHIEIDYHFCRERIINKEIQVRFISSSDQIADVLTKPLAISRFNLLCNKLTVVLPHTA